MSARNIFQELLLYQQARLKFSQVICDCASRPNNLNHIANEGIIDLLQPLIGDPELAVRSNAVCCFSRMANHSAALAVQLMDRHVPELILRELLMDRNNNVHYKRAVMQALKAMAKHSEDAARRIVDCGGLSAFLICLEDNDVLLKEAACCGIGCISRLSSGLAMTAINQGAAKLLVKGLQMPEVNVKHIAALALGDIARHSASHSKIICEAGGLLPLSKCIDQLDTKLKKQAMLVLKNIASHSAELAAVVVNADLFQKVIIHLGHDNILVQKQAARLIQEIAKHNLEMALQAVISGAIGPLVQCLMSSFNCKEDIISPCATALGFIAGQSPHFASAVIKCQGVVALTMLLDERKNVTQLSTCVWALGHIGKHSPVHSKALADTNAFTKILEIYSNNSSTDDLQYKCKMSLQACFQCCLDVAALEPLLYAAPSDMVEVILRQIGKVLPNDVSARRIFQTTGGLKKVQEIAGSAQGTMSELVALINSCYSQEIINYYASAGKATDESENVVQRSVQYKPQDFFVKSKDIASERTTNSSLTQSFH